ncbi:MAG: hypothetical protein ACXVCP_09310 [Bdellovibrio sp.]
MNWISKNSVKLLVQACFSIFLSVSAYSKNDFFQAKFPFVISAPWCAETISKVYNNGQTVKLRTFDSTLNYILYKSKLNFLSDDLIDSRSKQADIEEIGKQCNRFENNWVVLRCVSDHVHSLLAKVKWVNMYRPGTKASFCKTHAQTFKQVIEFLKIPGITIEYQDANFIDKNGKLISHVVNQIYVSVDDKVQSYILDVSRYPGVLFPVSID